MNKLRNMFLWFLGLIIICLIIILFLYELYIPDININISNSNYDIESFLRYIVEYDELSNPENYCDKNGYYIIEDDNNSSYPIKMLICMGKQNSVESSIKINNIEIVDKDLSINLNENISDKKDIITYPYIVLRFNQMPEKIIINGDNSYPKLDIK